MKYAKYTIYLIVTSFVLAEIILRLSGKFQVYSEKVGHGYASHFVTQKTWYHRWPSDNGSPQVYAHLHRNVDFNYPYSINKNGLRDKDYPEQKKDSTIRILVTGDSFAEGVGAPYDSTWPRLLEKYLRDRNIPAEVIDAGESGSDVIYDYVFYRDILKNYHPDLVIASMNSDDYNDFYFRGGMERFKADGTARCVRRPLAEYLFHYSFLFRAYYTSLGHPVESVYLDTKGYAQLLRKANIAYAGAMNDYQETAHKNGSQFVALFYAMPIEITPAPGINDSIEESFEHLQEMVQSKGVECLNVADGLRKNLSGKPDSYFTYEHDKHYNPTGYALFARLACDSLISRGIIPASRP